MAARVGLREISNEEGNQLLRIVRRGSGPVVTWRRAQIVLLAPQQMPAARIAEVVFNDPAGLRFSVYRLFVQVLSGMRSPMRPGSSMYRII